MLNPDFVSYFIAISICLMSLIAIIKFFIDKKNEKDSISIIDNINSFTVINIK